MYPILLDLKDKKVIVVGGGNVAERKAVRLISAEANVFLISPSLTDNLKKLADENRVVHINRKFKKGDLKNAFLVISATGDNEVNYHVFSEAKFRNILINIVDMPECCNFFVPGVIDRGDLLVTISTNGKSPAFTGLLREKLEKDLPAKLSEDIRRLGDLRRKRKGKSAEERKELAKKDAEKILQNYFKY